MRIFASPSRYIQGENALFENAKSYQEKQFTGKLAKHSLLHENPEVDKALINFLWAK